MAAADVLAEVVLTVVEAERAAAEVREAYWAESVMVNILSVVMVEPVLRLVILSIKV